MLNELLPCGVDARAPITLDRVRCRHFDDSERPLIGVTAELKAGNSVISILIGGKSNDHIAHIIDGATRVQPQETPEGAHEGLRIESQRGQITLLRFRSPASLESVDGIVLDT
jgi:hypothetical protein